MIIMNYGISNSTIQMMSSDGVTTQCNHGTPSSNKNLHRVLDSTIMNERKRVSRRGMTHFDLLLSTYPFYLLDHSVTTTPRDCIVDFSISKGFCSKNQLSRSVAHQNAPI